MWPSLARTGRRLLRVESATPDPLDHAAAPPPDDLDTSPATGEESEIIDDLVLTIGRPELDRLGGALQALLGPGTARPDTPARLEAALAAAVERLGGAGRPLVTRRPPGLYTPEAWQVRLTRVDPAIGEAIRQAARGAGFAR